jgi:hypothetical protein
MKLGSLRHSKKLDGEPVLVSHDNRFACPISHIALSVREALENWDEVYPKLRKASFSLSMKINSIRLFHARFNG